MEHLDKARAVAAAFELEVVGFYASTDSLARDDYPLPPLLGNEGLNLLMLYRTLCCPSCSVQMYREDGVWLVRGEGYAVPHGVRADGAINQKRILKEWHREFGEIDYSNLSARI